MTPGARLQAAIDLFVKAEADRFPFDVALDGFFRSRRYAGSKDRRSISERVWGILRRRARLDWWVDTVMGQNTLPATGLERMRARIIADVMIFDQVTVEEAQVFFSGSRHCPTELSSSELSLVSELAGKSLDHPDMPAWVKGEYPEWLHEELVASWGDQLPAYAEALNQPATLDFRVNSLKADRKSALNALTGEGILAHETPLSPLGIRVTNRMRLGGIGVFKEGKVDVQEEGSQILSLLVDARPGMTVVDYCAGAGGKTLAIAAQMKGKGSLIACDISSKRLSRMTGRLKKAGVDNVKLVELAPRKPQPASLQPKQADRVVLDVPCSGTGTWRRSPDSKWRLKPIDLERHVERQAQILQKASALVKPGGRLIYMTCSLLQEENEGQIIKFLQQTPDFTTIPVASIWEKIIDAPCPTDEPFLRLTPKDNGTDGFFFVALERKS